ncbi:MAG: hypothetical protein ACE5OS_15645 [Anaerolineae bacterium]
MKRQIVLWTVGIVLFGALLFVLGRLSGGAPVLQQRPPAYSLAPGGVGMVSGGATYRYGFVVDEFLSTDEVVTAIQGYLNRQGNPDLVVARLREFNRAYQAEVVERSTGRHAYGLMVSKATAQISPKAGPNLSWNTRYGSMIAEVGGGYGMLGRLLPEVSVGEMTLTEPEARSIAQEAVKELGAGLELGDETAVFYGFYEFYVLRDEEPVGELDVNGYSGQVWYKDWGEPQRSVRDLIP